VSSSSQPNDKLIAMKLLQEKLKNKDTFRHRMLSKERMRTLGQNLIHNNDKEMGSFSDIPTRYIDSYNNKFKYPQTAKEIDNKENKFTFQTNVIPQNDSKRNNQQKIDSIKKNTDFDNYKNSKETNTKEKN